MSECKCAMPAQYMPESCAQWCSGGGCANTGGDCKFRKYPNRIQSMQLGVDEIRKRDQRIAELERELAACRAEIVSLNKCIANLSAERDAMIARAEKSERKMAVAVDGITRAYDGCKSETYMALKDALDKIAAIEMEGK